MVDLHEVASDNDNDKDDDVDDDDDDDDDDNDGIIEMKMLKLLKLEQVKH